MERYFKICNPQGIHARPSSAIVQVVKTYNAQVLIYDINGRCAEADSVMALLILAGNMEKNSEIKIEATGKDSEMVLDSLCALLKDENALEGRIPIAKYFKPGYVNPNKEN